MRTMETAGKRKDDMSFFTELIAWVVVGDARYGTDHTPLDRMDEQAEKGLALLEKTKGKRR